MTQKDEALRMALTLAIESISQAIYSDDGLDGYKGQAVIKQLESCKAALSEPVTLPDGWVADPDTIPAQLIEITRQAICLEFGDSGTDGYYKRILAKIFKAMLQAAPTLNEKG